MIHFFRRFRQQFLVENKVNKYLLYAIGEIILVVIGILFALQINNWNENKKNGALVKTYKKNLIENLIQDSLSIERTLKDINRELKTIEAFEMRVSTSNKPFDTIVKMARYEYNYKITINYDFENDTYKILNSTGHLGLFRQEIIRELNELYNLQEKVLFTTTTTAGNYMNAINHYAKKYPFTFKNNLIQNGTVAADEIWNNISLSDHATEFNALIIAKSDCYRLSLNILPLIGEKTNRLLEILRK